ncbi:alpha/beta fold hydrolase [Aeromonas salmonicida subsp. achromogenes]|uniref:alpha/beta fold hydrolase n=1 Tax=Aeromonas salmonicida TaxID=645 RepID=UPI000318DF1A|nr:alpha/beta fold hydrolase [Aeromonas salmonicida]TMX11613.1 alpha/beta fold hydrolase [Aeromonas salmonicida subsp. achromogenes]TMX14838.1 alpha/beta fold hydrolase [Aeromonas salmonicida subsp. achromogenes]TMX15160.1 alpha/beta fold hydrolase [Aeromonas salmonicida subsp. achromogenes]TMX20207.1 alpha/beta fold hydrolase [Aeromonas salmonicida subsp. achromogenes]
MKFNCLPLLALTLFSAGALAVTNPYPLTSEAEVPALYQQTLPDFWRTHAIEGEFKARDGVTIRYAALRQAKVDRAIVIVNGRVESYLKYQELAWDLWRQGYSLYLIDHRGQGLSDRMLADKQKGYVADFEDYVVDLKQFHDQVIMADQPAKLFLLAHSMGVAISALYLERWPDDIKAAVLSSPMMGINLGGLPKWLAQGLAASIDTVGSWLGEPPYGPGQGSYQSHEFADNGLSHSAPRYQAFRDLYEQHPQIKLGGVTAHWIREGIAAGDTAIAAADRIKTPLLLLQAGEDSVVDNAAQDAFCAKARCEGGKPLRIEGAWHELFIEADPQRQAALSATLAFFERF